MGRKRHYKPGSFYRVDDRTGFPERAEETRREWNNLIVDEKVWEARHPQDFVRGVRDDPSVENARPISDPTFILPVWAWVTADVPIYSVDVPLHSVHTFGIGSHVAVMLDRDMGDMFHTVVTFVGILPSGLLGITIRDQLPHWVSEGQQFWNFSLGELPAPTTCGWIVGGTPPDPSDDDVIGGSPGGTPTPSPSPTPTPTPVPTDVVIGSAEFLTNSGLITQTHLHPNFTGIFPKLAFLVGTYHDVANDATETPNVAGMNFGVVTENAPYYSNFATFFYGVPYGTGMSNRTGVIESSWFLWRPNAASDLYERAHGELISGGMTLAYDFNDAVVRRPAYMMIGGSGFQVKSFTVELGSSTHTVSVNVGFQPDLIIFYGNMTDSSGTYGVGLGNDMHIGVATPTAQYVIAQACEHNSVQTGPFMAMATNRCILGLAQTGGSKRYDASVSAFTPTGFDLSVNSSAAGADSQYVAMKFGSARTKVLPFTTPTSTGNRAVTGVGFTPRAAIIVLSSLEHADPVFPQTVHVHMAGMSVSLLTAENQSSHAFRNWSGASASFASKSKTTALMAPTFTTTHGVEATLIAFNNDGMMLNYSSTAGPGKRGFIIFIE